MRPLLARLLTFFALTILIAVPQAATAALTITNNTSLGTFSTGPVQIALQANGGVGNLTWSISAGSLPAGLNLTGGTLTGTPTVTGTFNFQLRITDGTDIIDRGVNLKVAGPHMTNAGVMPNGTQNASYSPVTLSATGGSGGGYTFQLTQ